jgi:hypothetical protein
MGLEQREQLQQTARGLGHEFFMLGEIQDRS